MGIIRPRRQMISTYGSTGSRQGKPLQRARHARPGRLLPLRAYGLALIVEGVPLKLCFLSGFVIGLLTAGCQRSADRPYPNRAIRLVVPFAPGGGTDTFARIIKQAVDEQDLLPSPLLVVNIEGAGGTIGSRRVKNAKPDGYTLMLLHEAIVTARAAGKVTYGPEAFEPIAATGQVELVVAVAEDAPYRDLVELLNAARRQPDAITFAVNMGATSHFVGLQLESRFPGAKFRYVQAGGGARRFADIKGGHVEVTCFSLAEFMRFRFDGIRGLAVLSDQRITATPDLLTAREQGVDLTSRTTFYWWAPHGTADQVTGVVSEALGRALRSTAVRDKLSGLFISPGFVEGEPLAVRIRRAVHDASDVAPQEDQNLPNIPVFVAIAMFLILLWIVVEQWHRWHSRAR